MYKCSECGAEYETKPKYCDCGNDIFYEIGKEIDDVNLDDLDNVDDIDLDQKNATYSKRKRKPVETSFSPLAIGIFTACIILSLVILFLVGNPKKQPQKKQSERQETVKQVNIPPIDSYWDNTPAKIAQVQKEPQQQEPQTPKTLIQNAVKNIIPAQTPVAQQQQPVSQPIVKRTAPKTPKKAKIQTKPQTPKTKAKPKTQTKKQSKPANTNNYNALANRVKNNLNGSQNQTAAKTSTNAYKPAPLPKKVTASSSQSQPTVRVQTSALAKPTKSAAQVRQELSSYKAGLRNAIGRKVDFTRVIGDGSCTLSFKVNSNGKLYSKAFTKQSSNITLNDAAFNALNTTTSYNPPPDGYNGETLRLYIKFYNGNFEISLQ
ncbi:MAG TPA: hypothetical protein DEO94_07320 [Cyanobacteria bacterium UBA11991]|nr:TonB C-terminal domain-containing protein [Cyanobacteriota bacterium]MDY6358917.1 TonB C-terminal domain-containing protein [Cyanobacteriota bacterium]MDY6364004.1 TonB C-terminal domain-containing protein [Cyanobacteriota bacterium]HCB11919.1 hypothetical protein [Cyanobacteria bacterium UBA11991]